MLSVTAIAAASARRPEAASTSTGAPSRHEATKAACSAAMLSWSSQPVSSRRNPPVPGSGNPRSRPIITSLRETKSAER